MKELLVHLKACEEAITWAGDKTWPEIFETCHRGDWLLWLFFNTMNHNNEEHFTLLTHAKGHCANTVRHLMADKRSIDAVDAAINYNGDRQALKQAAYAAAFAVDSAYAYAYAAADSAAFADSAAADAADAAYAAAAAAFADSAAADSAYAAAADARASNQLSTANIVRQYIPIEKWNINI
jgi:hypothetical protein